MNLTVTSTALAENGSGVYQEITAVGKAAGKSVEINITSFDEPLPLKLGDVVALSISKDQVAVDFEKVEVIPCPIL